MLETLGDLNLVRIRANVYAARIKTNTNVKRYMFVVVDQDMAKSEQMRDLLRTYKSIQFKEFADLPEDSVLHTVTSAETIDYSDLVQRLASLRGHELVRTAIVPVDQQRDKVSQYAFASGRDGMVLLFHKTQDDYEFVDRGNLLSAIVTFNTLLYPEFTPISTLPVYEVNRTN